MSTNSNPFREGATLAIYRGWSGTQNVPVSGTQLAILAVLAMVGQSQTDKELYAAYRSRRRNLKAAAVTPSSLRTRRKELEDLGLVAKTYADYNRKNRQEWKHNLNYGVRVALLSVGVAA